MRTRRETGDLILRTIAAIDAKAVFDAITAQTIKITTDKKMDVPTLAVREQLNWVDTTDMIADALTKGEIDREVLVRLGFSNEWQLTGLQPVAFSVRCVQ